MNLVERRMLMGLLTVMRAQSLITRTHLRQVPPAATPGECPDKGPAETTDLDTPVVLDKAGVPYRLCTHSRPFLPGALMQRWAAGGKP